MRTLSLLIILCISLITTSKAQAPELPAYVPEEGLVGFCTFNGSAEDSSPLANETNNFGVSFDSTRIYQSNQVGVFNQDTLCTVRMETYIQQIPTNITVAFWFKSEREWR